ncbi:MAG: hypothetical protein CML42_06620 [Rhodobacteraceae bacterium]|mgnify:FL=1|nr:hypothetical protein [Paracoccaceae bacterium]|tara:strand:+ start:45148 stop:45717 length:570 start_codon:yes stop_codon:yes gene_type:complete
MSNKELLLNINNNILLVLEKINAMEKRLTNVETTRTYKKKINWIDYLKINFPDENNFNISNLFKINITLDDIGIIYMSKHKGLINIIQNKIQRNAHIFEGIKSFSKTKKIFIKEKDQWKDMEKDNIISIINMIKSVLLICTKSLPFNTEKEREIVDNVDKIISKETMMGDDVIINATKKAIYNTVKEDL